MLAGDGRRVFVGGNLGTPFAEEVDRDFDVVVLEISSFQAERIPTLHARAAVLLNVTDDHLDRYPDFEAYARAKGNVFAAMGPSDTAVIPAGDGVCARQAARGRARIVSFGPGGEVCERDGWLQDGVSGARHATAAIRLAGRHNLLNACAAVAMASSLGAPPDAVARALAGFAGLPHRTAFVAQLRSVRFYDDSKGTNVGASVVALRGLAEPRAVLVAGGRDKLGSYEPLVEALRDKGRALVVLGEAAGRIAAAASGVLPIARAATMSDAVREAFSLAAPGDAVLLSPACSSFDMFTDYKHRGRAFCEAVAALALELGDRPPRPRGGP
jgi:UDP-N-acetylmuramoylalanine--D-glutamate ligase